MSYFGCVQIIHVEKSTAAATNMVLGPKYLRVNRLQREVTKALGRAAIVEIDNVAKGHQQGKEHGQKNLQGRGLA